MIHIPLTNTYQPGTEPLLNKVYRTSVRKLAERDEESLYGDVRTSQAAYFLSAIIYSNYIRIEYANEKLRNALAVVREDRSLYRHEVKRHASELRKLFVRFDSHIASVMDKMGHLDYYDELTSIFIDKFDSLYQPLFFSTLQFMTRHQIRYGETLAHLSSAVVAIELTDMYVRQDAERYRMTAPAVMQMPKIFGTGDMLHHAKSISFDLSAKAYRGRTNLPNINDDKDVQTAMDNLSRLLANTANIQVEDLRELPDRPDDMMTYDEIQSLGSNPA